MKHMIGCGNLKFCYGKEGENPREEKAQKSSGSVKQV
jgi:hypothetical protein